MATPHPITDAMLDLPYGGPSDHFDGHFDGHPNQWRTYLDTLTAPAAERPAEAPHDPPLVTLYGWWWQPGLHDLMRDLFAEAGYEVRIIRTIGDALLLPRHPVGHVHVSRDGHRAWFIIDGHRFTWQSYCALASTTAEVQAEMGKYVHPDDEIDYHAAAEAEVLAIDLIRLTLAKTAPRRQPIP